MILHNILRKIVTLINKHVLPQLDYDKIRKTVSERLWNINNQTEKDFSSIENQDNYISYSKILVGYLNDCQASMQYTGNKRISVNAFFITLHAFYIPYILNKTPTSTKDFLMLIIISFIVPVLSLI